MGYSKPLPDTKGIAKTYWNGVKERKLLIQQCNECSSQIFYPRVVCPSCGGTDIEYREHSGLGEVYSYTTVYKPRHSEFKKEAPYIVALVDLDGGGRMMTNIVECDHKEIAIGQRVQIEFADVTDEMTLPYFKPLKEE